MKWPFNAICANHPPLHSHMSYPSHCNIYPTHPSSCGGLFKQTSHVHVSSDNIATHNTTKKSVNSKRPTTSLMALQEGTAGLAVLPTGPNAAPARVVTLTHGRLLVSALRLRRALKAEVGVLLSMLSASPLGSRRLLGLFSAEVQGITASHQ